MKDYYRILEVHPEASTEVVTRAYKTLVKKFHPDQYHISDKQLLTERMQAINEAYETLGDPNRRQRYDRRFQDYLAEKPVLDQRARRQQKIRNFVYWFMVAALLSLMLRGFLAAFVMHPMVRIVIIGLLLIWVVRLWRR